MTVDMMRTVEPELLELVRRAIDDTREIHHLREPEHPTPTHERFEVARRQAAPRRLERGRGHTRRRHEVHVELEARACVEQPVHAVDAEDVRDLVRVGDDGGRPEREHESCELVDHELHGLEVHVRVDEPGDDVPPRRVERFAPVVAPDPGNDTVDDGDVGLQPLAREHREDASSANHEVGRFVAASHRESALQPFHRRQRNRRRAVV